MNYAEAGSLRRGALAREGRASAAVTARFAKAASAATQRICLRLDLRLLYALGERALRELRVLVYALLLRIRANRNQWGGGLEPAQLCRTTNNTGCSRALKRN